MARENVALVGMGVSPVTMTMVGAKGSDIMMNGFGFLAIEGGNVKLFNLGFVRTGEEAVAVGTVMVEVETSGGARIEGCEFASIAGKKDAGIFVLEAIDLVYQGNAAVLCKAELDVRLQVKGCKFLNLETGIGGAVPSSRLRGGISAVVLGSSFDGCAFCISNDGPGHWLIQDSRFLATSDRSINLSAINSLVISKCTFENAARGAGGSVFGYDTRLVNVSDCTFSSAGASAIYLTNVVHAKVARVSIMLEKYFFRVFLYISDYVNIFFSGSSEAFSYMGQVVSFYESEEEEDEEDEEQEEQEQEEEEEQEEEQNGDDEAGQQHDQMDVENDLVQVENEEEGNQLADEGEPQERLFFEDGIDTQARSLISEGLVTVTDDDALLLEGNFIESTTGWRQS